MNQSTKYCVLRPALLFIGMVLYFSVSQAQHNDKAVLQNGDTLHIGNKILRFSVVSKSDFEKAPGSVYMDKDDERHNINADVKRVVRRKDSLILTNKDGRTIAFRNSRGSVSNDDREKYYFLDNLKEINQWLIYVEYVETGDYMLVDQQSGARIFLPEPPHISPGAKYVIAGSESGNIRGVNSLYFYEVVNKQLKLIGERELKTWGLGALRWINDDTVVCEILGGEALNYFKIKIE
jgi:hypothetical protein